MLLFIWERNCKSISKFLINKGCFLFTQKFWSEFKRKGLFRLFPTGISGFTSRSDLLWPVAPVKVDTGIFPFHFHVLVNSVGSQENTIHFTTVNLGLCDWPDFGGKWKAPEDTCARNQRPKSVQKDPWLGYKTISWKSRFLQPPGETKIGSWIWGYEKKLGLNCSVIPGDCYIKTFGWNTYKRDYLKFKNKQEFLRVWSYGLQREKQTTHTCEKDHGIIRNQRMPDCRYEGRKKAAARTAKHIGKALRPRRLRISKMAAITHITADWGSCFFISLSLLNIQSIIKREYFLKLDKVGLTSLHLIVRDSFSL